MIDRFEDNKIKEYKEKDITFFFFFDKESDEDERKMAKRVFTKKNIKNIAQALIKQLYDELSHTCRTELVKYVYIDIRGVYKPDKKTINMDFFTEYVFEENGDDGFYCGTTLGRYDIESKQFTEISNSMLDCCRLI